MIDQIPEGKTRLLLVEGKDDIEFFERLAMYLQSLGTSLSNYTKCEFTQYGGKSKLSGYLFQIVNHPRFSQLTHIGIVRDFDFNTDALSSIISAISTANMESGKNALPIPQTILRPTAERPFVTALPIPLDREGALETILLEVFGADPIMSCVDEYFRCIEKSPNACVLEQRLDKQRLHVFIAGKKVDRTQSTQDDVKRNMLRNIYSMTWLPDDFWEHTIFDDAKAFLAQLLDS